MREPIDLLLANRKPLCAFNRLSHHGRCTAGHRAHDFRAFHHRRLHFRKCGLEPFQQLRAGVTHGHREVESLELRIRKELDSAPTEADEVFRVGGGVTETH